MFKHAMHSYAGKTISGISCSWGLDDSNMSSLLPISPACLLMPQIIVAGSRNSETTTKLPSCEPSNCVPIQSAEIFRLGSQGVALNTWKEMPMFV